MQKAADIYGTLRGDKPYFIIDSPNLEASGNLNVLQNLDVCGNITFNNTDLSSTLANLVVDLTGGQDASFTNVEISGSLLFKGIDISDRLTNIDSSLVDLASGGGGGGGTTLNVLYDLEPNTTNSAAIINYIGENFKPYQSLWLTSYIHDSLRDSTPLPPPSGIRPFATSIVIPNGKLIFVPQDLSNVGIFDPDTEIYSSGAPITPTDVEQVAFTGGALAPNGKVIFAPYFQPNVGIYNPYTDTYTSVSTGFARYSRLFWGAVLAPNGKIIFAPSTHSHIGIFDPITETYTNGPPHLIPPNGSNGAFYGAILAPNGKIYFMPSNNATNIGIYDPNDGPIGSFTLGDSTGPAGGWHGGVLAPNGKIILVPSYSANIGIYDPDTDHFSTGDTHNETVPAFDGGVLSPDGKIILVPWYSAKIGIYDPITDIYTSGFQHNKPTFPYRGGTLAANGKIILTPNRIANIGIYGNDYPLKNKNDVLAPYFNN